jgi:preprotein translocase subunit YajC
VVFGLVNFITSRIEKRREQKTRKQRKNINNGQGISGAVANSAQCGGIVVDVE